MCRDRRRCGDCNNSGCCNRCESIMRYTGPDIDCVGVTTGDTYETVVGKLSDFICNNLSVDGEDGVGISDITYDPETDTMTVEMTDGSSYNIEGLKGPKGDPGDSGEINIVAGENIIVTQETVGGITTYTISSEEMTCCQDIVMPYTEVFELKSTSKLEVGRTYHIVDRDIWVRAVATDQVSSEATRRFHIVKDEHYTPNGDFLGIYGQTIAKGSVPNSSGTTVYRVIWGGRVWERDSTGGDVAGGSDEVIQGGWTMIPTTDTTYYEPEMFSVDYDIDQDIVWVQRDCRGNVIRMEKPILPPSIEKSHIDITDWGNKGIVNNSCSGVYNNHGVSSKARIYENILAGAICNNSCPGDIRYNEVRGGNIKDNSCTLIEQNRVSGGIDGNTNDGIIMFNRGTKRIFNNSSDIGAKLDIINNTNVGSINGNNSSGNVKIENNTNNGPINGNAAMTVDISDPIVDK